MTTTLLPYNAPMRARARWTTIGVLTVLGLAACAPPPKLGAPRDSFTPATFKLKIAEGDDMVAGAAVTARFFTAERVAPMLGRPLLEADAAGHAAVVLSYRYWVDRFGSSPTAIGSPILVDGRSHVIVGVMPEAFQPEGAGLIWIPKAP
jgi:hypothetical protein